MCAVPSNSFSTRRREEFLRTLFPFPFQLTEVGFELLGRQFLYKHTIEKTSGGNLVWQWKGLKLLNKFDDNGIVVLEVKSKSRPPQVWFVLGAAELRKCIKGRSTFSVPADDARFKKFARPLVELLRGNRFDSMDGVRARLAELTKNN